MALSWVHSTVAVGADDPSKEINKAEWNDIHTASGSVNINGVAFDGSADITVTAAAGTLTGTTLKSTVVTSSLTSVGTLTGLSVASGSLSASTPFTFTQTWNNAGTTFEGITFVITDTNSAAGSLALKILGGAAGTTHLLDLTKGGNLLLTAGGTLAAPTLQIANALNGIYIGAVGPTMVSGGAASMGFNTDGAAELASTNPIYWRSGTLAAGSRDTNLNRVSAGLLAIGTSTANFAGSLKLTDIFTNNAAALVRTNTALTNGAGVAAGTLLTAPTAGNPTKWIGIDDNGTTRYIPAW